MAEITREEFLDKIREKQRKFEYINFEGLDLRDIDLRRLNFTGANFCGARFNADYMQEANFTRANLRDADMTDCKLAGANLEGAIMQKATLLEADLTGAQMQRADLRSADLTRANCTQADLRGADLSWSKLVGTDLRQANLIGTNFSGAVMWGALLRDAHLRESIMEGAIGFEHPSQAGSTTTRQPTRPVGHQEPNKPNSAPSLGYHPPQLQRPIPAKIFTSAGWIQGSFPVPKMHGFMEYLNQKSESFKLTEVTLLSMKRELESFELRAAWAYMIIPECDEGLLNLPGMTVHTEAHRTYFLMEGRSISGNLTVETGIHISDYLSQAQWILLRNVEVRSSGNPDSPSQAVSFPLILLNTKNVTRTSEDKFE